MPRQNLFQIVKSCNVTPLSFFSRRGKSRRFDDWARVARSIPAKGHAMSVVSVEERGSVSIVSINRPEKLNAINKAVAIELQAAFAAFDRSAQRVAILTGVGGRAFSAGADVTDLPELLALRADRRDRRRPRDGDDVRPAGPARNSPTPRARSASPAA
jgi:hypothetical protein